jgi:hypothetical protein
MNSEVVDLTSLYALRDEAEEAHLSASIVVAAIRESHLEAIDRQIITRRKLTAIRKQIEDAEKAVRS